MYLFLDLILYHSKKNIYLYILVFIFQACIALYAFKYFDDYKLKYIVLFVAAFIQLKCKILFIMYFFTLNLLRGSLLYSREFGSIFKFVHINNLFEWKS